MQMDTLRELYVDELKDLYSAEKQLLRALPKMARNASNDELKAAFTDHLNQTEEHVRRLERVFELLEESPRGKKCVGMEGLIEEGNELVEEEPAEEVLDAGLISKAQRVEHYEIAGYGTVRTYALMLGEREQAELLEQTLNEEKDTDQLLTQLAEQSINIDAVTADADETTSDREVSRAVATERKRESSPRKAARKQSHREAT